MVTVGEYISIRLKQLGAEHLFCVPGNYSAEFLLAAQKAGIRCIGTTNELEAGYAADAYSRYKRIGVCSVTYGVGSQSLYNATAGSYVEFCPVVLINGSPPLSKVENLRNRGILFAHAIDPLRTDKFIFEPVTVASTEITHASHAPEEVDRVLRACITQHRPVYLEVHQGIWTEECDSPIGVLVPNPPSDQQLRDQLTATSAVVKVVLERLANAKHSVLWGGEMLQRLGLMDDFRKLVQISGLPYTTTAMGKGIIGEDEFPDQFIGVYDSKFARHDIKDVVEQSDCLIALGTILSDFYTDIVLSSEARDSLILAAGNAVNVGRPIYTQVPLERFLPELIAQWPTRKCSTSSIPGLHELISSRSLKNSKVVSLVDQHEEADPSQLAKSQNDEESSLLTWDSFFERMKTFITPKMVVLTDTSLALFPSAELPICRVGGYLTQTAWLSIGYTGGATLGVALAQMDARAVAFVGDGGFQMVPQAFSTLVRETKGQNPSIVFVMDNGLYGIEQFLIDEQILPAGERFYRDRELPTPPPPCSFDILEQWDYEQLGAAFRGKGFAVRTHRELEVCLAELENMDVPALVAVKFKPHDLPRGIQKVVSSPRPAAAFAGAADAASGTSPDDLTQVSLDAFN
jgi:indolepyruvate decarboxylase